MATKQCAWGQTWFLLMDGHHTHYSLKMIQYAVKDNIVMVYILDIQHLFSNWRLMCVLTPLQLAYSKATIEHLRKTRARVI